MKIIKRNKHSKPGGGFKGQIVDDRDPLDNEPTGRYMQKNPYKTPPNNLTTKDK